MDKLKRITFAITLALTASFVVACSSDNEPAATSQMTGKEKAEFIKSQVLNSNGDIDFYSSADNSGVYLIPVRDDEEAIGLAKTLSCSQSWDGTDKTVELGDGYGTVRLMPGNKEGVFTSVVMNVKGIPFFTLELATLEYCQNENGSTTQKAVHYMCLKCFGVLRHHPDNDKCPLCGNSPFKYKTIK